MTTTPTAKALYAARNAYYEAREILSASPSDSNRGEVARLKYRLYGARKAYDAEKGLTR